MPICGPDPYPVYKAPDCIVIDLARGYSSICEVGNFRPIEPFEDNLAVRFAGRVMLLSPKDTEGIDVYREVLPSQKYLRGLDGSNSCKRCIQIRNRTLQYVSDYSRKISHLHRVRSRWPWNDHAI